MQIADPISHRLLAYIHSLEEQGYAPSVEEVRVFRARRQIPAKLADTVATFAQRIAKSQGTEAALTWLLRVGWIRLHGEGEEIRDDDEVRLTDLGRAALRGLNQAEAETAMSTGVTVVLDQDDPLALARAIGAISGLGECFLVDPYFRIDVLFDIKDRTEVTRVLTGPKGKGRLDALRQAIATVPFERSFEIRIDEADGQHDRYAIGESKAIVLGTSVGGVGRKHSLMIEMHDHTTIASLRRNFEDAWKTATPLEPVEMDGEKADPVAKLPADSADPATEVQEAIEPD